MVGSNLLLIFITSLTIFWIKVGLVNCIVGGQEAKIGDFKYMVSVQAQYGHICGGGIIGEFHVISAAHCFVDKKEEFIAQKFTVVAGITKIVSDEPSRFESEVEAIYIPIDFKRKNPNPNNIEFREESDIAVLQLKSRLPFEYNPAIGRLGLPKKKSGNYLKYFKTNPIITGFGADAPYHFPSIGTKRFRDTENFSLKSLKTTVLQKLACKSKWPLTNILESHMCAQTAQTINLEPTGVCDGDSGSPLVLDNVVIGVLTTVRPTCNEEFYPALYTRVANYMSLVEVAKSGMTSVNVRIADYDNGSVKERSE